MLFRSVNDKDTNIPPPPKANKYTVNVKEVTYGEFKSNEQRPITLVNGKPSCDGCVLEITKEKFAKIVLSVDKGEITRFLIKFPKRPTVKITNSNVLNEEAKMFLKEAKNGQMAQIFGLKSSESDLASAPVIFKIVK